MLSFLIPILNFDISNFLELAPPPQHIHRIMKMDDKNGRFRIAVLGDADVGKSGE